MDDVSAEDNASFAKDYGAETFENEKQEPSFKDYASSNFQTLPGGSPVAEKLVKLPNVKALSGEVIHAPMAFVKESILVKVNHLLKESAERKLSVRHGLSLKLVGLLYSSKELAMCNCTGTLGSEKLDTDRMQYIREITFTRFPCSLVETQEDVWKFICSKIDAKHRNEKKRWKALF